MDAWQRLQAGLQYNDFDPGLFDLRVRAKRLFRTYNATEDDEAERRRELLSRLLGHVGADVWIEPDFHCEFGNNISIGDRTYLNFGCTILDCAPVTIGADVLIGPNVGIYAVNHAIDPDERSRGACSGKPVSIGDRVWIGGSVTILAGVSIGEGSIVGAGSVVTKPVPAGVIAAGNPCHVIRKITEADKTGY